jgi:hypothetical protein
MPDPFISREDLSDYLGRDVTADDGALIAVDSACEIVRTITEQDFNPATETVNLDGSGTDTILLPQRPVRGAGTVVVNGGTLESDDYGFTESGQLIRTDGTAVWSTWARYSQSAAYWPRGRQNVSVTYEHGYLAGTATDVPSDVRKVALNLAYRGITQGNLSAESLGQVSKTYAVGPDDLTETEKLVLTKHRR